MKLAFAGLFLCGGYNSSFLAVATDNGSSIDASIARAKKKFHSFQSNPLDLMRGIQSGEYEKIFVEYHQCVWSEFSKDGENYDEARCNGGDDGEDQPWYMGKTPCYRSNVAYSLYGVRVGDDIPENVCRGRYYINTFVTNNGMDDFGGLVGLEHQDDATSVCTLAENEQEDNDEGNQEGGNKSEFKQNTPMYPNARSYTTYCLKGKFVTAQFEGSYCSRTGELEMLDTLADLNSELDDMNCILAYTAADENENDRRLEEGEEEAEEEKNEDNGLWNLLSYSSTCSNLDRRSCPDPYGVQKHFGMNPRTSNTFWKRMNWIDRVSLIFFTLGCLIYALTYFIEDKVVAKKRKRKGFGFRRRGRSKSPSFREGSSRHRRRGRSRSPSKDRVRSRSANDDNITVDSNNKPVGKNKRGGFRAMFSRKK